MFLTPLLVGFLMATNGEAGFNLGALETILLQLLAPFILGQILEPWIGKWIRSKKKILTPVDRGSILMVVYLAFSESVSEGLWQTFSIHDIGVVIALDILLLVIVLTITMFGSRLLGFTRKMRSPSPSAVRKRALLQGFRWPVPSSLVKASARWFCHSCCSIRSSLWPAPSLPSAMLPSGLPRSTGGSCYGDDEAV